MAFYFRSFLQSRGVQLALLGIAVAFSVHLFEISEMGLWADLHSTADDASYFRPSANFLKTGVWKDYSFGPSSFVQRPPLTGIFHLLSQLIFGAHHMWGFFCFALVFHGLGVKALYDMLRSLCSQKWATASTLLFILLPCFWGFLSYSLSEAFEIAFLLLALRPLIIVQRHQLLRAFTWLLLLYLLRPVLVLCVFPLLIFRIIRHFKTNTEHTSFLSADGLRFKAFFALTLGFVFLWEARKVAYTSEISLHPIYHEKNGTIFRPPHAALTRLFKLWEVQPEEFHWLAGLPFQNNSVSKKMIAEYSKTREIPLSNTQLLQVMINYSEVTFRSPKSIQADRAFVRKTDAFTDSLIAENRFQYWVKTPLLSAKEHLLKSHLNFGVFQEKYRGNVLVEALRYGIVALLVLGYFSLLVVPFFKSLSHWRLMAWGGITYFLFLIFYQRMNEDRYLLPVVLIGYLSLSILTFHLSERFRKVRKPSS